MSGAPEIFDRRLLLARRNRVADRADAVDFLLRRVAKDLAERVQIVTRNFAKAANIGAYHGLVAHELAPLANVASMLSVDASERWLARVGGAAICADEEQLPFRPASLDLIVSGLSLQLVNDLPGVLSQCRRALQPDGLFLAALAGGETLHELREAWLIAEEQVTGGASPRVAPFADVRQLGGLLQRAGFALPVVDSELVRVTYPSPLHLMRELKAMGMSNMLTARQRVPVSHGLLMRAGEVYAERFALPDGRIPATFEIITLTAWAPHDSQPKPLQPGSAKLRLADVLGAPERPVPDRTDD